MEGYQTCADDGSGYGACLGCADAGALSRTDGGPGMDASGSVDAGDAGRDTGGLDGGDSGTDAGGVDTVVPDRVVPDTGAPDTGAPDTGTPDTGAPDTGMHDSGGTMIVDRGVPSFAWVWLDRGGPALQPHACRAGAGVVDGMLVDPRAFFSALVAGRDPNDWTTALNDIEGALWACGVGQQRGSAGNVRGRLFLPNASCPDASPPPGDSAAMRLGVRQEPSCWAHAVDVVTEQ